MARSLDDVDSILGEAPSPDREVMRIKQYIDFGIHRVATPRCSDPRMVMHRGRGPAGRVAGPAAMVCALAAATFDVIEKRAILRILRCSSASDHAGDDQRHPQRQRGHVGAGGARYCVAVEFVPSRVPPGLDD